MSANTFLFLCMWPFIGGLLTTFFVVDGVLGSVLRKVLFTCFVITAPVLLVLWMGFRAREKQAQQSIKREINDAPSSVCPVNRPMKSISLGGSNDSSGKSS